MSEITVSESKDYFIKDGKPFFYLADTIWMAFSKLSESEWRDYLHYRKVQGFNVVQVSLFPLDHDNSADENELLPFMKNEDGTPDYYVRNDAYFNKVEKMIAVAAEYGITVALHLVWAHHIPDSWASKGHEERVIPEAQLYPIYSYAVERVKKYHPVYAISGDVRFENQAVTDYCMKVLKIVNELDNGALTTLHIAPGEQPDDSLIYNPALKFYSYQSGHSFLDQDNPEKFSAQFLKQPVKRPIVNTEPSYEGHKDGFREGRFRAEDVRRMAWSSLMTGAKAGITYGAHGIWSCHRRENFFNNTSFSGIPYDFGTALRFPGAWDYSFAKAIFEYAKLYDIQPAQELLENPIPGCYCCKAEDKLTVYLPYNSEVILKKDVSKWNSRMIILEDHNVGVPVYYEREGKTIISVHDFNSDVLYLFSRN